MNFLNKNEDIMSKNFLKNGFIINRNEKIKSFIYINSLFQKNIKKILNKKIYINFNKLHNYVSVNNLNDFRLNLIHKINKDRNIRFHYFNLARNSLYNIVGNELMMQNNINLSIQFPNDESSLLPIHSDVWSGDSPYEVNLWLPLVDCYKTKSMYILKPEENIKFIKIMKNKKYSESSKIYKLLKKKVRWIKINKGNYLLFNQNLPHGNVVNKESETRISMNCRYKSLFSPYADKKIGEFFSPITERVSTKIGNSFQFPF